MTQNPDIISRMLRSVIGLPMISTDLLLTSLFKQILFDTVNFLATIEMAHHVYHLQTNDQREHYNCICSISNLQEVPEHKQNWDMYIHRLDYEIPREP